MRVGKIIDTFEVVEEKTDIIWKVKKNDEFFIMKLFYKGTFDLYTREVQFNPFIIQSGKYKKHHYIVMTLFPTTLDGFITDLYTIDVIDMPLMLVMVDKLKNSLREMHSRKIIHRDIKPENIVLTKTFDEIITGADFDVYFIDYELAHPFNCGCLTPMTGTICFVAPEILMGKKYDYRIDIWSLGCCIYELFMGESLFDGENPQSILDDMERLCGPISVPNRLSRIHKKDKWLLHKLRKNWSNKDSKLLHDIIAPLLTKKKSINLCRSQ